MKKRIVSLFQNLQQCLSDKCPDRNFFSGVLAASRETQKVALWVCVGISFALALQVNAFSGAHPQGFFGGASFSDVKPDDWFAPHVEKFQAMGVIEGEGTTGNFAPNREANRAEIATMFSKYDEKMRVEFATQLKAIRAEILAEVQRDFEVQTHSFKNQLERKIKHQTESQSSALSVLEQKTEHLEVSLSDMEIGNNDMASLEQVRVTDFSIQSVPEINNVLRLTIPSDAVNKMVLVKQGVSATCPQGWSQASYQGKWFDGVLYYERICVIAENTCQVTYHQGTSKNIGSCMEGSKQADYWYMGNNESGESLFRRVCYVCQ